MYGWLYDIGDYIRVLTITHISMHFYATCFWLMGDLFSVMTSHFSNTPSPIFSSTFPMPFFMSYIKDASNRKSLSTFRTSDVYQLERPPAFWSWRTTIDFPLPHCRQLQPVWPHPLVTFSTNHNAHIDSAVLAASWKSNIHMYIQDLGHQIYN